MNPIGRKNGGPYRSDYGMFFGVVSGLAEHWGVSTVALRLIAVLCAIFLAFWPAVLVYLIMIFIMPREPIRPVSPRSAALLETYGSDQERLYESLERRAADVETLVRRLEDHVTSSSFRNEGRT
jgi:phage shock protein PspC (stress-responsive transcriptional regulator)